MVPLTAPFDGERTALYSVTRAIPSGNVELTFLGHPLESLGRVLDPVLAIIAVGGQQPDHLIGAAGGRPRDIAGREIDSLSNVVLMLQRYLHYATMPAMPTLCCNGRLKPYYCIARCQSRWPVRSGHSKYTIFARISGRYTPFRQPQAVLPAPIPNRP